MASYICCGCDFDMTAAVEQAFATTTDFEGVDVDENVLTLGDRGVQGSQVQVTCPNGHTCTYTRA